MAFKLKHEASFKIDIQDGFKSYISNVKSQIETELVKLTTKLSGLYLHPQIEYAVLSKGKRLRPLLTILSAESVGGKRDKVMSLALAFELMHTATLVHDDIIDQDEMRRNRPALHKKWSTNDAILTGDALIALSVDLASGYGQSILKTVAHSALQLCDGEKMDITFSIQSATEEMYLERIKAKSASLFRASTYCGALAGGGSRAEVNSLSSFGENFGIAYQLKDDLADLINEGNLLLRDLKNGTITLPLIHAYSNSSLDEQKRIDIQLQKLMIAKNTAKTETAENLLRIIRHTGSLDYCEKKMEDHLHRAIASITKLKDTEYKTYLAEMTRALRTLG